MNHWADYLVFAVFICISLGIGCYHALTGGRQRTTEEFIMADRQLKIIPTTLSMLMSYNSAIIIIGSVSEIYTFGIEMVPMSLIGFTLAVLFAERISVPWLYPLKLTSVNQYFEMRFGDKEVRAFASLIGIVSAIMYMGVAMYAPALALETATGFPKVASIPIMSALCVIYTAMGGMRAVIWTDVFQSVVMLAGMMAILCKGMTDVGVVKAFDLLAENNRTDWIHFSFDPQVRQTIWGFTIGWSLQWGYVYGLQQASVQRFSGLPSLRKARLSLLLSIPGLYLFGIIAHFTGVAVFAHYATKQCDPVASGTINRQNQLLPIYVKEIFGNVHGFSGLFLSTLFSGALSSVSSSLSGCAANAWEDILKWKLGHVSELTASLINKALVVLFGVFATAMSFLSIVMAGPVTQIATSFFGACGGPAIGMFLLSGIRRLKWVRARAVLVAGIGGIMCNLWIAISAGFVKNKYEVKQPLPVDGCDNVVNITTTEAEANYDKRGIDHLYGMSFLWYTPFGILVTMFIGLTLSLVMNAIMPSKDKDRELPDELFIPFEKVFDCTCASDHMTVTRASIPCTAKELEVINLPQIRPLEEKE